MFTRKQFSFSAAILMAVLALPSGSSAQEWNVKWSDGFKVENPEAGHKLAFGGRIQADYTFSSGDAALEDDLEDGFEFRRGRLFFSGTLYKKVTFKAEYDFVGGDTTVKDLYIGIKNRAGEVRFGHYNEDFSLEQLTSSKYSSFLERALPVEAFAPGRNAGLGMRGHSGDRINWGVGYFQDTDADAEKTDDDRTSITGRFGFRPFYEEGGARMLHLGAAVSNRERAADDTFRFRVRPEAHLATRFVNTDNFAADSATLTGLEVAGVFNRFWFASEVLSVDVDAPASADPTFDGYYAQAGYFLTKDHRPFKTKDGVFDRVRPSSVYGVDGKGALELVARVSSINLNDGAVRGGQQDNLSLGVNWYLNPATRLMVNLVQADVEDLGTADFVLVRFLLDF